MSAPLATRDWVRNLSQPERRIVMALEATEYLLEDPRAVDRLRVLAAIRQALTEAYAVWGGKEGDGLKR